LDRALWLFYAASLLPIGVGLMMSWKTVAGGPPAHLQWMGEHPTIVSAGRTLSLLTYDLAVVGMVAVMLRNYHLHAEADQRRRIRWVVYCSTLGLLPQVWDASVSTAQLVGALGHKPINELLVNAATCAIPISVAYAVVKHRLFDIKVVVRRGLQYLLARRLLQIFLALPIVALAYAVFRNRDRTIAELLTGNAMNVVFIAMLTASVRFRDPLRRSFSRDESPTVCVNH
jgi:eukaryotic-like serine/threonine-protein kinase